MGRPGSVKPRRTKARRRKASKPRLHRGVYPLDDSGRYYYDPDAAERVILFASRFMRHWKGQWAGQLFSPLDWQADILRAIFGWKRLSDDTRRYRRVSIWVAKKNGKTFLAAVIALYLLVGDGEPGADVFSAAVDKEQAKLVFTDAKEMVRASPPLAKRIITRTRLLYAPASSSSYSVLSADVKSKHGLNIHGLVADELHAWPNRDMWDTLRYGTSARRQPMIVSISTAGIWDPEAIGWEEYEYARDIRDGLIDDPTHFVAIYEANEKEDLGSPETWRKANPSMGHTVTEETLAEDYKEALQSPNKMSAFKRLRLNIWTNAVSAALDVSRWKQCGKLTPVLGRYKDDTERLERAWYAGMDLSSVLAMTSVVLVSEPDANGYVDIIPAFWLPEETLDDPQRPKAHRALYHRWKEAGVLQVTQGSMVDYRVIKAWILEQREQRHLAMLAFDPWNSTQIVTELQEESIPCVEVRQGGKTLSAPIKHLQGLVKGRLLRHGNNPILNWQASSFTTREDTNQNLAPHRGRGTKPIDGIVALVTALTQAMHHVASVSVYEARGIVQLGGGKPNASSSETVSHPAD